jgi:hypothetical protein
MHFLATAFRKERDYQTGADIADVAIVTASTLLLGQIDDAALFSYPLLERYCIDLTLIRGLMGVIYRHDKHGLAVVTESHVRRRG